MLESAIDPAQWQLELERVLPKLKFKVCGFLWLYLYVCVFAMLVHDITLSAVSCLRVHCMRIIVHGIKIPPRFSDQYVNF